MGLTATAVSTSEAIERGADTPALDATYAQDAIETQRDKILVVGGAACAGDVLGVHVYQGEKYAFRNNAAATAALMFKSTAAGWVQQSLGYKLDFTSGGGAYEPVEGDVITGAISGAVATITRVVTQSGTMAAGTAAGYLIFASQAGTFQAENLDIGANLNVASIAGDSEANSLPPGGRYEFKNYNFFATSGSFRMYGVNGVGPTFEWDGSVFVPIITGNTNDKPTHLAINEYHLMLCFEKGSLQNSATGTPYVWSGSGASEIGTGDELVGLEKEVGGALAVICRNRSFMLHGKNTVDSPWDLRTLSDEAGGIEWTLQRIGYTRYMDDRGFVSAEAVQEYGDFNDAIYSQLIEPLVQSKKTSVVSSVIVRSKNQLRTFFSDGTGIIATFDDKKLAGFTTVNFINAAGAAVPVSCTANGEDSDGNEIILFGSTDGYVYQMDKGTSFDGAEVNASLVIAYTHLGSPSYNKQYKKVVLECDGAAGAVINYNALYDYSLGTSPVGITLEEIMTAGGSYWNAVNWNAFTWAAEDVARIEGNIDGEARNIALQIASSGIYVEPHTIYGITYHYINRKLVR